MSAQPAPHETPRERFIAALERRPLEGRVPHFELVFYLTMEAFGKVHPDHRSYHQWLQMSPREQRMHLEDMAGLFIATARRYEHSAIFVHPGGIPREDVLRLLDTIRELSGDAYFLMLHGDATYEIPTGGNMMEFTAWLCEEPDAAKAEADRRVNDMLEQAEALAKHGALDGFALCADYCFNSGPFMSPAMFDDFVTPYLHRLVRAQRDLGFYVIKHTDGNILPILDRLIEARPHAVHSLDPQGGVDIADIKRRFGNEVCLIGNVNCGLLTTGTDEEVVESARYALRHGMPGGGYIFSTSNCVFTGMPLDRYELMLRVWREEGNYPA